MQNKTILKRVIRIAVSAVLILILCLNIDFATVWNDLINMRPWFLGLIILFAAIAVVVAVAKWRVLLPEVPFAPFLKAFLYGCFFTLVLPGQVFGEAAKIAIFGRYTDSYDRSISTVIIDKITGIISLIITGLIGLLFTKLELPVAFAAILIAIMVVLLVLLFSLRAERVHQAVLRLVGAPKRKSPKFNKACDSVANFVDTWRAYLFKPALLGKSLAMGILFNVALLSQYILVCWQYNIPISVIDMCWIMAIVNVMQVLPISLAGIGVRDASLVTMFAYIGIAKESAMIMAMVLLLVIIFRAIAGAGCILYDMIRK